MTPRRINLCHAVANQHGRIFDELLQCLASGLRQLDFAVSLRRNHLEPGEVNLLLGQSICLDQDQLTRPGLRYMVYQLEQLSREAGFLSAYPGYLDLLGRAAWIFDYSPRNLEFLTQTGLHKASLLPLAYDPCLQKFAPALNKDIDVAFFGALSPRREKILHGLEAAGVKLAVLCGIYGAERDALLGRAKIVLNIHQFAHAELEELRLSYLVSNACCVVSETAERDPYGGGVTFERYDNLIPACLELLEPVNAPRRIALARQAKEHFSQSSFLEGLRRALGEAGL